ncbi:arginyltransferase [Ectothiorhodospiraceae bacterium 2226]|nr:arginyltransferase [Ectothiorhodospiraceae bacterium 2226]
MKDVLNRRRSASLTFYATVPSACGYLDSRSSVNLFADPAKPMTMELYSRLADYGFRRNGEYVYRPRCPTCDECIPLRVPVAQFAPNRSQRRTWQRNAGLEITRLPAGYRAEHFDLYRRYISTRHAGSGMDTADPASYRHFINSSWAQTWLYEFRERGALKAVAVVDELSQGLSAVYTFFDPREAKRGLGTYAILWEIEETRRLGYSWLYLGYWIADSPKMRYKTAFEPVEAYRSGRWQPFTP